MIDPTVLPAFAAVILLFLLPPGPDMAFMVAVGLERGRSAAVRAILGIGTGMTGYAAAVVLGLAGVVRSEPLVLDAIKLVGAAYLLWLAVSTFRGALAPTATPVTRPTGRPYARGVMVSATNPKIALFFLAVLPQFTGDAGSAAAQLALLGAVNVALEVLLYGSIGLMAGTLHRRVGRNPRAASVLEVVAATVYAALAVVVLVQVVAG